MACWPTGAVIVAARERGLVHALTISSFTSVSVDPLLVLVCVRQSSRILPMIERSGTFSVSVLAAGQDAVSAHFASPDREPAPVQPHLSDAIGELPGVDGALALLACAVESMHPKGDHTIVIGRVTRARACDSGQPLVYCRRGYHHLATCAS